MYEFYTGEKAIHLATPDYRFCQFDLWDDEAYGEGDTLFVVIPDRMDNTDLITLANGKRVKIITSPDFQSLRNLNIKINKFQEQGDFLKIDLTLNNQSGKVIHLNNPTMPAVGYMQGGKIISKSFLYPMTKQDSIGIGEKLIVNYKIPVDQVDQEQKLIIFTQTSDLNRGEMATVHLK
jgi:hypothetical protein